MDPSPYGSSHFQEGLPPSPFCEHGKKNNADCQPGYLFTY